MELAVDGERAGGRLPVVFLAAEEHREARAQQQHEQLEVEAVRGAQHRLVAGVGERGQPFVEAAAVRHERVPGVEIDRGRDLLLGGVLEQPASVGEPDRLRYEAELRGRNAGDHLFRRAHQLEQLGAAPDGALADQRDLLVDRQRSQRDARGDAVRLRQLEDAARSGRQQRRLVHRREGTRAARRLPGHVTLPRHEVGGPVILRLWAFMATVPLGMLAVLTWPGELGGLACVGLVVATGAAGAALAALAARLGDDAPDRAAHVARGASVGLAALPAAFAAAVRLGPSSLGVARARERGAAARALARQPRRHARAGSRRAARERAPRAGVPRPCSSSPSPSRTAGSRRASPEPDRTLRAAAFDLDSRVPLRAPSRCAPRVARTRALTERGAAPRLASDGATVWFEAREADGRLQLQRLSPGGAVACWTCAEPGNNRSPRRIRTARACSSTRTASRRGGARPTPK